MELYQPPKLNCKAFNCPHCNAYARQSWSSALFFSCSFNNIWASRCDHCENYALWNNGIMVYPENTGIQNPNIDLNEEIQQDYIEAQIIVSRSPRGAAALLRLCIQKLCKQLGEDGKNINHDIKNLVSKGLPEKIQQALDIVRVVGNNAVHPGQIDLNDNKDIAVQLFGLVNLIADVMITQPKQIEELYRNVLPETTQEAIEIRDKTS